MSWLDRWFGDDVDCSGEAVDVGDIWEDDDDEGGMAAGLGPCEACDEVEDEGDEDEDDERRDARDHWDDEVGRFM